VALSACSTNDATFGLRPPTDLSVGGRLLVPTRFQDRSSESVGIVVASLTILGTEDRARRTYTATTSPTSSCPQALRLTFETYSQQRTVGIIVTLVAEGHA
jgi:hypothetical protein